MPLNPESSLKRSARPALALHQWEAIKPHLADTPLKGDDAPARCLLSLLGNSRFLVDRLINKPHLEEGLNALLQSAYVERSKPRDVMQKELETIYRKDFDGTAASVQALLRHYKYQEMTRIAGRDLSGIATFEETGRELAALAAACCETAYEAALEIIRQDAKTPPFCILGMGKLGGDDLNFSSDIDLLYVHGDPLDGQTSSNLFTHFSRVSETITKILHERTHDGIVFRVDLDLRPEGKSGVLVNSLEALTSYYEASGAIWERGALTKARPVAGNYLLGQEALVQVEPFVYPASIDASAILHLKEMKQKINAELKRNAPNAGFNLKLGVGGIREIEFFVTAFQLIFGGKEPRLRERNTLKALQVIENLRLVPAEHIEHLKAAYMFFRRAENRLQMDEERQVHSLPKDKDELEALAIRCGYAKTEAFLKDVEAHARRVSEYFGNLAT